MAKTTKYILLNSPLDTQFNWTVPSDWNSNNNRITVIGGGGSGGVTSGTGAAGGGGGGSCYVIVNFPATANSLIPCTVGSGGAGWAASSPYEGKDGNPSLFSNSQSTPSYYCIAQGGKGGTSASVGGLGGTATGAGGYSFSGGAGSGSGGGGGAAGHIGNGVNAPGNSGGDGNAGFGGKGNVYGSSSSGVLQSSGKEIYPMVAGSGGGGSNDWADGGLYGSGSSGLTSGGGRPGVIIIEYTVEDNQFISPEGELRDIFLNDYTKIDETAMTGSLWVWGSNSIGALGTNDTFSRSSPVQTIAQGTNWKQISCAFISAGIKNDGTLWLWGSGLTGKLGDNTTISKSSPVQTIAQGTNWKQVSCSPDISGGAAAIKTDGTLWLWGYNLSGQLGDGTRATRSSPVQTIAQGTNWKQVSCGNAGSGFTAATKTDGTLWTWGDNSSGNLGDNTRINRSSPVQTVSGGTNWKQVSCGGSGFTAAIKTDGTLWLWGSGSNGQLGTGDTLARSSPVQTVSGGTNWKQVSCGYSMALALKTNGTLWAWGSNGDGQLGDGTRTSKQSPVQTIAQGTNWKSLGDINNYTSRFSGAIKTDGTLWLWGLNSSGQLGTGNTLDRSSPVQTVSGGTNWKQVSIGDAKAIAIHFYDANNLYPNA